MFRHHCSESVWNTTQKEEGIAQPWFVRKLAHILVEEVVNDEAHLNGENLEKSFLIVKNLGKNEREKTEKSTQQPKLNGEIIFKIKNQKTKI